MRKCERGGKATVLNNNSCHWIEVIGGAERGGTVVLTLVLMDVLFGSMTF